MQAVKQNYFVSDGDYAAIRADIEKEIGGYDNLCLSENTTKIKDIFFSLWGFLVSLEHTENIHKELREYFTREYGLNFKDKEFWESEEASYCLDELFDVLAELSPVGYEFGCHEFNPTDVGFWAAVEGGGEY
ncbi:MAG: hypothetical protein LBQ63_00115 [Deltaproteobacteria bacterium]|jgi:hypothetical protein|nr:hypothetical protein [Deltaproteobacteria bacterium]